MRALAETLSFAALALGIHLGALAIWQPRSAAPPQAGNEGVPVEAASPAMAALVAGWESAPDAATEVSAAAAPLPDAGPLVPPPESAGRRAGAPVSVMVPAPESPPEAAAPLPARAQVDVAAPAPPAAPAATGDAAPPLSPPSPPPPPSPPGMLDTANADAPPEEVDAAPPGSPLAPVASLRPEAMPDRPAPVRTARAVAREKGRMAGAEAAPAAGSGAAAVSRAAPQAGSAPRSPSAETLQAQWGASVKGHIAGRAAPPRGVSGRVGLVVSVATDGRIAGVGVARSSGDARADRAAAGAVQRVGRVPRAPGGLPPGTYRFAVALTLR